MRVSVGKDNDLSRPQRARHHAVHLYPALSLRQQMENHHALAARVQDFHHRPDFG